MSSASTRCYKFTRHDRLSFDRAVKDAALWDDAGDCFIFHDSTNAAAYRISSTTLQEHKSSVLLKSIRSADRAHSPRSCDSSDSGYESSHLTGFGPFEIHIPVPVGLSTKESSLYLVTTRNYFAYLHKQPLVGPSLGIALRDVWQRIQRWHAEGADLELFLSYCKIHGYTDLVGRPNNATALLVLGESARIRNVWIHAFAHCVAMHDRIIKNSDFDVLSNTTKALITKASLEMELHIRRVVRTIGNFLEGELSSEKLGLSKPARDHLDHFRSFLHSFFLDKLGYFPPSDNEDNFDKDIWRDIHDDFKALYEYLADTQTANDSFSDRGVIGGVCVHQNVDAFNQRHSYEPLRHPLPLLPDLAPTRRTTESQVSLRNFLVVRVESDFRPSIRQALSDASNSSSELAERPIVQDYVRFERQKLEEKLSIAEARKVRWLLIYCTLQMLISIVSAPEEIHDADSAPYPLCVNVSVCPIWTDDSSKALPRATSVTSLRRTTLGLPPLTTTTNEDNADRISIHPDCEADSAQDFFQHQKRSSWTERSEDDMEPHSARSSTPLSRSLSIRTSVNSSMNALKTIGGLARRSSSRRASPLVAKRMPSLPDFDSQDDIVEDVIAETPTIAEGFAFDFAMSPVDSPDSPIPLLEDHQLDFGTFIERSVTPPAQIIEDEQLSPVSGSSPRSSAYSDEYDTPITEPSSGSNSTRESRMMGNLAPLDEDNILVTPSHPSRRAFQTSASSSSLSIGCYVPTGYNPKVEPPKAPISKFAAPQRRQVYERRQDDDHRQGKRPLQGRYGRSQSYTAGQSARYTWGDMP